MGGHTTAYVRSLLLAVHLCMDRIATEERSRGPYPREREAVVLERERVGLRTRLWRVRVPFLDPSTANEVDNALPAHSLVSCVEDCVPATERDLLFIRRRLSHKDAVAHVVHLHFLVLTFSNGHTFRMRAL
ncbi:hypothetical protein PsYK624_063920 [Phanerochaete sordida]|uniref:Secreted protein n=1 Tax=Phanerochaete sordida TaxID=48140 RepID=A0A9P3G8I9_9APHY|nr:hypothetical protein PsYK624_063920 [Phanerochaete sordida]